MIKDFTTISPYVDAAVFALTFVVKTVYLGDVSRFVIPSNEGDTVWVSDLEDEQEEEGFYRVEAAIDKITWEGMASLVGMGT